MVDADVDNHAQDKIANILANIRVHDKRDVDKWYNLIGSISYYVLNVVYSYRKCYAELLFAVLMRDI